MTVASVLQQHCSPLHGSLPCHCMLHPMACRHDVVTQAEHDCCCAAAERKLKEQKEKERKEAEKRKKLRDQALVGGISSCVHCWSYLAHACSWSYAAMNTYNTSPEAVQARLLAVNAMIRLYHPFIVAALLRVSSCCIRPIYLHANYTCLRSSLEQHRMLTIRFDIA